MLESGGGGRSHVAEPGEQGRRVARSEVALLAGHHEVRKPIIVEVGEGRVGATAHIDHAVLKERCGLQVPDRFGFGSCVAVEPDALSPIDLEGHVGGEEQVADAVLIGIEGVGRREALQVEGHTAEVGGPGVVGGRRAVLPIDRFGHVAGRQAVVRDVSEQQVEVAVAVELEQCRGAAGVARDASQFAPFPAGPVDIESAGVLVTDIQSVVLGGLIEHAVAAVRHIPDQGVSASHGALLRSASGVGVEGRARLRPGHHVEVTIPVKVIEGGNVRVEADEGQLLVPGTEIPVAEQVGSRVLRIGNEAVG